MSNLKIDQEEFNRKAQHILDTVVRPQVEKYEQAKAIDKAAEEFAKKHSIYPTAQDDTEYGFKCGAKWMREQKRITLSYFRRVYQDFVDEKITMSRMVELLNEREEEYDDRIL